MGSLLLPLLVVANVLGVGMVVPQALRLHRTGVTNGVSAGWVGISLATNAGWIAYAIDAQLWGVVPVSIGALIVYAVIAGQLGAFSGFATIGPLAGSGLAMSAGLLAVVITGGWPALGIALAVAYGLQFTPAVLASLRSADRAGIAPATWLMAAGEAAIWVVYGLAVADPALVASGAGGTVMASIILARLSITSAPVPVTASMH